MNKIVFLNRFFYPDHSATSQMLTDLVFALRAEGAPVWVVTSRLSYENRAARLPAKDSRQGVVIRRIWTSRFGRANLLGRAVDYLTFYLSAFWTLVMLVKPGDIVVAKTDPPLISVVAWTVVSIKRARLINWLQDVFPEVAVALGVVGNGTSARLLRGLRNASLRAAQTNVVIGKRMREHVCGEGIDEARIRVIHNWANARAVQPVQRETNPLRTEWELGQRFVVGYSGNLGRSHEINTIVKAMNRLRDEPDIVFLFIGGGAGWPGLERAVREYGLHNVRFRSYQPREHLSQSLGAPDIHLVSLLPAVEGLIVPSKVYGILAAARPVCFIGDPEGEIASLLKQFGFGFTVGIGDDEMLAQRLLKLARDPAAAAEMGAKARAVLEERFDLACALAAWKQVLGLNDGKSPARTLN